MADSDNILPKRSDIKVGDARYKSALSEAVMTKIGASINFINNRIVDRYVVNMGGYFRATGLSQYTFPSIYIKTATDISYYTMSVGASGSGSNSINFKVIDETGIELGDLFTTAPVINQASLTNAMVGYDVKNSSEIRKVTTTGYSNGIINPSYTSLLAGYELRMYIVGNGTNALNLTVNLGLEAQE